MLLLAITLFAVAALGGITLAILHLRHKELPLALALAHGLLAASGLVILILVVVRGSAGGLASVALGLFVLAALGGFGLFSFHLRRQPLPTPLVFVHGLAAVIAFLLLLARVLRGA
ncbi:MAG TPA: hypothetical protein VFN26_24535 [Candidatus Acidoferrum sp.]|nr:hypothetical protein [Candidatus Acidoferrum sp.]